MRQNLTFPGKIWNSSALYPTQMCRLLSSPASLNDDIWGLRCGLNCFNPQVAGGAVVHALHSR
jgi:hypothetical protein